jgi:hypothetical protein
MTKMTHKAGKTIVSFRESRREFLLMSGVAAGQMAALYGPSPVRSAIAAKLNLHSPARGETPAPAFSFLGVTMPRRRSFFDYAATDIELLTTAYGALKNLPMNDSRTGLH